MRRTYEYMQEYQVDTPVVQVPLYDVLVFCSQLSRFELNRSGVLGAHQGELQVAVPILRKMFRQRHRKSREAQVQRYPSLS